MKIIYLISTMSLRYPSILNRSEHGLLPLKRGCVFKIGEADDALVRVKTLDGTFVYEKPNIIEKLFNPTGKYKLNLYNQSFLDFKLNDE